MISLFRLIVYCFISSIAHVQCADRKACQLLGFTAQLRCGSCKELAKYNLSKIEPDCFDCCEADDAYKVIKRYAKAELVACS
ncbi:hypothetical protein CRM22_010749 [Opisthorchis felineus]|uniref:Selenoprotein F/M domain-containing protein n=1 Tax=Opisthorchis felineus TaxID=147828 RepID=A0A4S2KPL3_OPIFE|nr:hypothetical protein CRM22_010749 [Opisthorchis felineus]